MEEHQTENGLRTDHSPASPNKNHLDIRDTDETLAILKRSEMSRRAAIASAALAVFPFSSTASAGNSISNRPIVFEDFRNTARADYGKNMAAWGGRLSNPPDQLLSHLNDSEFDVLVVGSGFGASVVAARLSAKLRPGKRLGVLERGREWIPGTLPSNDSEFAQQTSTVDIAGITHDGTATGSNPSLALYQITKGNDLSILNANALGGGSQLSLGMLVRPEMEVFAKNEWPSALREFAYLEPYFHQVEREWNLRSSSNHSESMNMNRVRQVAKQLEDIGAHTEAIALTIAMSRSAHSLPVLMRQGMLHRKCVGCGDCASGCNVGAKQTLSSTYLPIARRHRAEIYSQIEVQSIEKVVDRYRVHFTYRNNASSGRLETKSGSILTKILVIGAGTVGSPKLLMQSRHSNLCISEQIGQRVSTNSETMLFATSERDQAEREASPTAQGKISFPQRHINEARNTLIPLNLQGPMQTWLKSSETENRLDSSSRDPIAIAFGHDQSRWRWEVDSQSLFPQIVGEDSSSPLVARDLQAYAEWSRNANSQLPASFKTSSSLSMHATGGCVMADDPAHGVVNHRGQVFDTGFGGDRDRITGEFRIHAGLYVVDGSIIPRSLSVPPSLTIAAVAERTAQLISLDINHAEIFDL